VSAKHTVAFQWKVIAVKPITRYTPQIRTWWGGYLYLHEDTKIGEGNADGTGEL